MRIHEMSKKAIVCVDDEAIILLSLKQELKTNFGDSFVYETALNAQDALETVESLVEDGIQVILIITDWLMPGLKGDEFLKEITSRYDNISAIMITGHADRVAIERVESDPSVLAVLTKPWNPRTLRDLISERARTA